MPGIRRWVHLPVYSPWYISTPISWRVFLLLPWDVGTTNFEHEPSQVSSTLDGSMRCDLDLFAGVKLPIQLYSEVFYALAPHDFVFSKLNLQVLQGSPVYDQQSLGVLRSYCKACAMRQALCLPEALIDSQFEDPDVFSDTHDKCVICEADDVLQQVDSSAGIRCTWRFTRMVLPVTPEGRYMLSLFGGTICRPLREWKASDNGLCRNFGPLVKMTLLVETGFLRLAWLNQDCPDNDRIIRAMDTWHLCESYFYGRSFEILNVKLRNFFCWNGCPIWIECQLSEER